MEEKMNLFVTQVKRSSSRFHLQNPFGVSPVFFLGPLAETHPQRPAEQHFFGEKASRSTETMEALHPHLNLQALFSSFVLPQLEQQLFSFDFSLSPYKTVKARKKNAKTNSADVKRLFAMNDFACHFHVAFCIVTERSLEAQRLWKMQLGHWNDLRSRQIATENFTFVHTAVE